MREADLCMVLGNLLENALRASERLPEAMRRVSVICLPHAVARHDGTDC